ncbi:helix-turn-helix domain-containing protein [Streptomyces sp. NPDC047043]|uniref:nSTAND1 domain-containing NTPase n=1 Tax=Streptomyces sp. NPDC047043 TaxID=3154497 RepID=UPI003409EEA7
MTGRQRGRPERPLDPDAGPVQRFAHELRSLRAQAGSPSYRTMSEQARVSVAALSRAASGERLPSVAVVRAYAQACGADPDAWEGRLDAAADEVASCDTAEGESPYQGLARFEPGDQELFFGRDELAEDTVQLMKEHLFAVLVGASGSGKSSLLRAGVMPRLQKVVQELGCDAELRLITPGARPAATHARLLAPAPGEPSRACPADHVGVAGSGTHSPGGGTPIASTPSSALQLHAPPRSNNLARGHAHDPARGGQDAQSPEAGLIRRTGPRIVVVDQFEEIFTLCRDRAERWRFVDQLLAAKDSGGRLRVVVAVGAGFHGRCAEHPGLAEALRHTSLTVGPMTREALRDAVVRPATAAGLRVERELTARIVEEVHDQPGALPMLSHALRETWRRRRSGVLTLAAYEEAGGVHGAIAAAAEEVYGGLSPDQAGTARRLLLALIAPGDGTADSRRPVRRADLREWPDPEVPIVLERLSRARLITVDEENVELAHEALITGWPRLQCWIEENRERLRMHRHLTEAARNWQEHGRDPGTLYRGVHLALADVLFTRERHDDDLTARERAFLCASRVAHRMERWTAARMQRRIRRLVLALTCVMAGALVAGQIAWHESDVAEGERSLAGARQAADFADRDRVTDPRTRTLLSIAAWRLAQLPESRAALFDALAEPERDAFTDPDQNDETRDFLTDSGRTLLSVGGGSWSAWDVATHSRTGSGRLPDLPVTAVSLDGRTLALAGTDADSHAGRRLWRLPAVTEGPAETQNPSGLQDPDPVGYQQDPVGHRTAADSNLGVDAYVVNGPDTTAQLRAFTDDPVVLERSVADVVVPSADAQLAAVCAQDGPLTLRDIVHHRTVSGEWQNSPAVDCSSASLVFDRAGTHLAAVSDTGIHVWDTASGRQLAHLAQPGASHLAFTPDGRFLAAAGQDGTTVWRISAATAPVFRHTLTDGPVTALAWDPAAPTLRCLTGSTVHSLDLTVPLTSPWLDRPLDHETLGPDGRLLATAERHGDRYRFHLRDTRTGRVVAEPPALEAPGRTHAAPLMTFSPDGRAFAYGIGDPDASGARFVIWNTTTHRVQAAVHPSGSPTVRSIALAPGGRELLLSRATATGSPTGEVWNTARGTRTDRPEDLAATLKSALASGFAGPVTALPYGLDTDVPLDSDGDADLLALSPDGAHLATGGDFGSVTVWHGRRERHREAVLPPAAGARVTALAFSPDGRTLAVGYGSGALRLWDTDTRQPLGGSLNTPGDAIRSLAFGAHGDSVYASSAHVPVQRYAVGPAQVVARLCARAGRNLTANEWRTYLPDVPFRRLCDVSGSADPVAETGPAPAATPHPTAAPAPEGALSSSHAARKPASRKHASQRPGARVHGTGKHTAVKSPEARREAAAPSAAEAHPHAMSRKAARSESGKNGRGNGTNDHGRS